MKDIILIKTDYSKARFLLIYKDFYPMFIPAQAYSSLC